ncbi:MAG: rhomboid family intramembrane serine protease [Pedobacter sp.]|nr:MAG: rhomboid family intramembrane serine protease [Pedobacter sp.]
MNISWGYSPKIEKFIPLGEFPADKYLVIARQAIENLGWNLSYVSARGIIAYTPISLQSYSEEISIRIENNFAIFKSECVGIQMLFTDYGKNSKNLSQFFNEFEYVEFHLKDVWEETLKSFHNVAATQDLDYFDKAPLTAKNKIKNVLYLLWPQHNYRVTPILILLNAFCYLILAGLIFLFFRGVTDSKSLMAAGERSGYFSGANSRELVLNGQYWRLISYQFVHGSKYHLFFNMYALVYIGLMVEHKLGIWRFFLIYILSGICAGLISIVYHDSGYMIGASGAIMGMFGAFIALLLSRAFERNATKALLISTLIVVAIMVGNGFLSKRVDNAAHVGGLISGFVLTYLLYNEKLWRWKIEKVLRYGFVSVLVILLAGLVIQFTPRIQTKEFLELEKVYQQNWAEYGKIYTRPYNLSREEKIQLIEKNGIRVWRENASVVKEMEKLTLTDKQMAKVRFHAKMVEYQTQVVSLLYKEYTEDTKKYRLEMKGLMRQINELRMQ